MFNDLLANLPICGFLLAVGLALAIVAQKRPWHLRHDTPGPWCRVCGYSLVGSVEATHCPECGAILNAANTVRPEPTTGRWWTRALLWTAGVLATGLAVGALAVVAIGPVEERSLTAADFRGPLSGAYDGVLVLTRNHVRYWPWQSPAKGRVLQNESEVLLRPRDSLPPAAASRAPDPQGAPAWSGVRLYADHARQTCCWPDRGQPGRPITKQAVLEWLAAAGVDTKAEAREVQVEAECFAGLLAGRQPGTNTVDGSAFYGGGRASSRLDRGNALWSAWGVLVLGLLVWWWGLRRLRRTWREALTTGTE